MNELPALGVGIIFAPGLEQVLEEGRDLLDLVEIEPETLWLHSTESTGPYRLDPRAEGVLSRLPQPKVIHGVGFPIGGTNECDRAHLERFRDCVQSFKSPWVSEHLSINTIRRGGEETFAGFLLPPLHTPAGVVMAADKIQRLQAEIPVPFAFEIGANYLRPREGELPDSEFFSAIAETADCGILLDLHNLWANERNGRQSVQDVVAGLPRERVLEVHLAGGSPFEGYWLDAHSGTVPNELKMIATTIIPQLPNLKAIVFEIIPDYMPIQGVGVPELLAELRWMRELWQQRGSCTRPNPSSVVRSLPHLSQAVDEVSQWEARLGQWLAPQARPEPDPGIRVYRSLIRTARAGTLVATLTLTTRLIRLYAGEARFTEILEQYFAITSPKLFASDEADAFGSYLSGIQPAIPFLLEVLTFELAQHASHIYRQAHAVPFACDATPLLEALSQGRLPATMRAVGEGIAAEVNRSTVN